MDFGLEFGMNVWDHKAKCFYEEMQKLCKWIDKNLVPIDEVYKNGTIHY